MPWLCLLFNFAMTLLWAERASAFGIHTRDVELWLGAPLEVLDNRATGFDETEILEQLDAFRPLEQPTLDTWIWPFHVDFWFKFRVDRGTPPGLLALYKWGQPSRAYFVEQGSLEKLPILNPRFWGYAAAIELPAREGFVLLRIEQNIPYLPDAVLFQLMPVSTFHESSRTQSAFFAAVYGIIVLMIFYNASLCFTLRRLTHLTYIVYGCFLLVYIESVWGFASGLFDWKPMSSHLAFFSAVGTGLTFMLFLYFFLALPRHYPRFSKVYIWTIVAIAVFVLSLDQFFPGPARFVYLMVLLVVGPLMPFLGIMVYARGYKTGFYMAISAATLGFGTASYVLGLKGFYTFSFFTENLQLIGFVIEMAFLSLGMGHQLRLEQDEAISRINHSYTQLQKLVYPHQLLMIQDGFNLEKTLPVGESHAVVLAFDIIQSTQFEHPDKRRLFQAIFQRCYREMMKDYDNLHLAASAFRIKEMGDGFLCSVGFPFKTPFEETPEAVAVQLAFAFLDIAHEEIKAFDSDQPMHVSIGIASGQIEGFFAQSGMRSYELFGEAIVLADRYESLRKVIHRVSSPGHIISAQARVVEALPLAVRKNFHVFNLPKDGSLVVRDDPDAAYFFYYIRTPEPRSAAVSDLDQIA